MAQAFSCQPLTVLAEVCMQGTPHWVFGGQNGTGTGFALSTLLVCCHSTNASHC